MNSTDGTNVPVGTFLFEGSNMKPVTALWMAAWGTVCTIAFFVFHPKELGKALLDPRVQGVYHLSSMQSWFGAFMLSLGVPEWARHTAATVSSGYHATVQFLHDSGVTVAVKEAWVLVVETAKGGSNMV